MILTDDQRREFLFGDANYQIPLAAIRKNLWPKTIPYTMDSTIGMLLLLYINSFLLRFAYINCNIGLLLIAILLGESCDDATPSTCPLKLAKLKKVANE